MLDYIVELFPREQHNSEIKELMRVKVLLVQMEVTDFMVVTEAAVVCMAHLEVLVEMVVMVVSQAVEAVEAVLKGLVMQTLGLVVMGALERFGYGQ